MSGGVDSSVVAGMLQARGENVIGLTMQLWNQRRLPEIQSEKATLLFTRRCLRCPCGGADPWDPVLRGQFRA